MVLQQELASQQELFNSQVERIQGLLGQPPSVLDSLIFSDADKSDADKIVLPAEGFVGVKEPEILARNRTVEWYPASVTLGGFVYSSVNARFDFGDHGDYVFDAGFWGAFGGGAGGGGGPWSTGKLPQHGEEMEFALGMAAATGGEVQMYWWRKGQPIQGMFVGIIGGLGVGGTKGKGKWKKA